MSSTLGIDFSSHAVDLVKVDENEPLAVWLRVNLEGRDAFARTRAIRDAMPGSWFYDDVYLVAIEKPMGFSSRLAQSVLMRVQGAVLVKIPTRLEVWEPLPSDWKKHLGLPGRDKPTAATFAPLGFNLSAEWPQDALDALAMGVFARDVNARGVAAHLAMSAGGSR